jgi:5-methylcytosine-specific restriction endonuclease McrA
MSSYLLLNITLGDLIMNIECNICGNEYKGITNTHLKTHGLTIEEYKEQFPLAKLTTSETNYKKGALMRGKTYTELYGIKKSTELKKMRRENAIIQMQDKQQISLRKEKCGNYKNPVERANNISKATTVTGAYNYRKRALDYYEHLCNRCDKIFKNEKEIRVHHIDHNNLLNEFGNHDISNLELLCVKCHANEHKDEVTGRFIGNNNINKGIGLILVGLKQQTGKTYGVDTIKQLINEVINGQD